MAINYASQFAPKVLETFAHESLTDSAAGREFQFSGAKTVKVLTVDTVPLNDYNRSGTNRYGEPVELGDTVQELTMEDDKSFAITIDKGNNLDQMNLKGAAEAMKRQVAQVVVPYVDKYRLARWSRKAGFIQSYKSDNILNGGLLSAIFDAGAAMDNAGVPLTNRTLFIANSYYKSLALSDQLIGVSKLGERALAKGIVGEIDGMVVKRVPDNYFPDGVIFLAKWKNATVDPVKLQETKIHIDPPGLSGNLLEGRAYQDAFVLEQRSQGLFTGLDNRWACGQTTVTISGTTVTMKCETVGSHIFYTVDGTNPRYSPTAVEYTAPLELPTGTVLKVVSYPPSGFCGDIITRKV